MLARRGRERGAESREDLTGGQKLLHVLRSHIIITHRSPFMSGEWSDVGEGCKAQERLKKANERFY